MIDVMVETFVSAAANQATTALLDTAKINKVLDSALRIIRKAVAEKIRGFDTGAIQIHALPAVVDTQITYFVSVLPEAKHRESLYDNATLHSSKYSRGLKDIIALKQFGTGHADEIPLSRRRGYWTTEGVWTMPLSTVGDMFLYDAVREINKIIRTYGLPGIARVGDSYSV